MLGIMTNNASIIAQNAVANTQMAINTSVQRLSTGLKLNSAQDDPAGLGIAARMTAQVNGINQAVQNANYGVSLTQTAGGALNHVTPPATRRPAPLAATPRSAVPPPAPRWPAPASQSLSTASRPTPAPRPTVRRAPSHPRSMR